MYGENAIQALHDFINELEEQRDRESAGKQTTVLIKLAKGLISSIETQKEGVTSDKDTKETPFMTEFKKGLVKHVPKSLRIQQNSRLWKYTR